MSDNETTTFLAFLGIALGGTAIYAAYKNLSWSSVIASYLNPKAFSLSPLPPLSGETGDTGVSPVSPVAGNSDAHAAAVAYAVSKLGDSYIYGASGPRHYDCSGLTMQCAAAGGYNMPHNAELQWEQTRKYSLGKVTDPPAGTFVYYGFGGVATHCGISIGSGTMIEAPHTGDVVKRFNIKTETQYLPLIGVTDPLSHVKVSHGH